MYSGNFSGAGNFSYQYNKGSNYKDEPNVVATVDTFKAAYTGTHAGLMEGFKEVDHDHGTYANLQYPYLRLEMRNRFAPIKVKIGDEEFGELHFAGNGQVTLSVLNTQFYTNADWNKHVQIFNNYSGLHFSNVRMLHIALDTYSLIDRYNYCFFKRKGQPYSGALPYGKISNNPIGFVDSIRVYSLTTRRHFQIYDKQSDVEKKKPYILDYWKKNGLYLIQNRKINRLELRYVKVPKGLETQIDMLTDQQFLFSLIRHEGEKALRFKVKPKKGQANKTRWPYLNLIDWSRLPPAFQLPATGNTVKSKNHIKGMLKKLYLIYLDSSQDSESIVPGGMSLIMEICLREGLQKYFERKQPEWKKEYQRDQR
ncbi:hypothetical protein [Cesiribacter andamanensis]|uniref:Uncharacterized protein n=1 Tax=Cesiribacter andamanensis AMV16 TaxID=1279009 RepID=M7NBX7_9BACT|nr:hypothetical protein [Cesiribacter andamanensis]EMR04686.1 hypothetical protein ADICEAN_00138 [Cesiribacter andamanensis AMV16]